MLHGARFLRSAAAALSHLAHALLCRALLLITMSTGLCYSPTTSPSAAVQIPASPWQQHARTTAKSTKVHPAAAAALTVVEDHKPAANGGGKDHQLLPLVLAAPPPVFGKREEKKAARGISRPPRLVIPPQLGAAGVDPFGAAADRETDVATEVEVRGEGFCLASRRGVRHAMEDGYGVVASNNNDDNGQGSQMAFYGVYDGHGGRAAVDFIADKLGKNVVAAALEKGNEDEVMAAIQSAYLTTDSEFLSQNRTVHEALNGRRWVRDILGGLTVEVLIEYLRIWDIMETTQLNHHERDKFVWKWSGDGNFSAASTYAAFFHGQEYMPGGKELWKTRAPNKCRFFFWLALYKRCWTSARLQRHNLPNHGLCALCDQEPEEIDHLLLGCVYSRECWFKLLRHSGTQSLTPTSTDELAEWWLRSRKKMEKGRRKGFDSLVVLVVWQLWKERNRRVFNNERWLPQRLINATQDEAKLWYLAGIKHMSQHWVRGGACASTALVKDGELYVANVGDCRAVLGSHGGVATALTSDHTAGREDERCRIESSGGYVSCCSSGVWRVQDCLAVTRAFGDASMKPWVTAHPDLSRRRITPECSFLVLASDGLWNKVSCQEAVDVVSSAVEATTAPCKELVAMARSRGSRDDITVMVVDLQRFLQR
ncbi:hypothetical protein EJB05_02762, partial [Eragrostis curvula]